ncbi:polysaccharide deacetylase family protein [Desulfovibrio sp. OttesenSCG-928-G15]|nr:polysaccharide deacetylase family protein [Desulfovibrio sp. OttesenSCG-928-G15]
MTLRKAASLPVVMYHYVNEDAGGITLSPARFEDHCRTLAQNGWRGVGLDEAEAFFLKGAALPERSVLLTFDDGFLDNYQTALPILARHGHKGVVFAVSSRLEKCDTPRISVADALSGKTPAPPEVAHPLRRTKQGHIVRQDVFMSHAEARAADTEGTLAVASHCRGHFGVFTGPEFADFFRPRDNQRTFFRTEAEPVWGLPDFSVRSGLAHRAFLPAARLVEDVQELVPQNRDGADEFFANPEAVRELRAVVERHAQNMGRLETDEERLVRMRREIAGGKNELEAILGHELRTLCWPWGEYDDTALALAQEAGFRLLVTTAEGPNTPGDALAVHRFKGKDKSGDWLVSRLRIYSRPLLGKVYARLRI